MSAIKKLWDILTRSQKRAALVLMVMAVIATLMEIVGLGLVVPLVGLMTSEDIAQTYPALAPILERFGGVDRVRLIYITLGVLGGVYVLKTAFMLFQTLFVSRFSLKIMAYISRELFSLYLRQSWLTYREKNRAWYMQIVNNETQLLVQQGYGAAMEVIINAMLLVSAALLLMLVEPVGTLVMAGVLALFFVLFQYLSRLRVSHWGRIRQEHEAMRLQCLQQGLGSAKDIRLRHCDRYFTDTFHRHSMNLIRAGCWQSTLRKLPRYVFELMAVFGLIATIVIMVSAGRPLDSIAPVVGLFAAIFIKLLPSVNAILSGLHSICYIEPTINTVHAELAGRSDILDPGAQDTLLPKQAEITLKDVSFRYPGAEEDTLKDISLGIPCGTSVGVIGASGAGKSTLIDVLLGLVAPSAGILCYGGINVRDALGAWQSRIGYVPQTIYLLDDTLRRNIAFGVLDADIDEVAVLRAVKDAQLEALIETLPEGLDTVVGDDGGRLSGGERQRVGLARALYRDPSILLLDEATASLDPATEAEVMKAVQGLKGNHTILTVTHRYSAIEDCDMVIRIEQGRIVDIMRKGTPGKCGDMKA